MLRAAWIVTAVSRFDLDDLGEHGAQKEAVDMADKSESGKPTFTAAQIAKGDLEPLGKRIEAHLEKMRGYEAKAHAKAGIELKKADDHWNSITQLLAEAKVKCDRGGFNAFQKKYCPDLGRSRIYELLAIGSGKKSLEETRAKKRESVAKSRGKVSATPPSVADKSQVASAPEPPKLSVTPPDETPEGSAEKRKVEYADEIERFWKTPKTKAEKVSFKKLAHFKYACETYFPKLTAADLKEARTFVTADQPASERLPAMVMELKTMAAKPTEYFVDCEIEPSDLETVADFLHMVAAKVRNQQNTKSPALN